MRRIISFLVIFISIIASGFMVYNLYYTYNVELVGNKVINIPYSTSYEEQGFTIKHGSKEIDIHDSEYDIKSNIVDGQLGDYEVTYNIKYKGREYNLRRRVSLIDDIKPEISTEITSLERNVCNNKYNKEIVYTAKDNYDGDLTEKVEREELDDKLILKVKDSSGNENSVEIPVSIKGKGADRLLLNGNQTVQVSINGEYSESGAYLADGCNNKIDDNIEIIGSVDISKEGTYTITYKSKTKPELTKERTVMVYNIPPYIKAPITGNSVIYLTFDDGPSAYTSRLLDILDKYNVKATFFVTNQFPKYQNLIGEEYRRGHTVGVHTLTHRWNIYDSLNSYWSDFNAMNDIIEQQTGQRTNILRFPGGTSNRMFTTYMSVIARDVLNKGYQYYDWNVCVEDSGDCVSSSDKKSCVLNYYKRQLVEGRDNIVLMHDIKSFTIDAMEEMIKYGLDHGYTFKAIDSSTAIVHFRPYK